jgi:hypothetical protein
LALILATTMGLTGCANEPDQRPDPDRPAPVAPIQADDLAFFDPTVLPGAALARPPGDLTEAVAASTAVIVAEVVDVRPTRTLAGETDRDTLEVLGVVLRPVEILHGAVPAERGEVVVEFLTATGRDAALASMRSSIPQGEGVWFLQTADIGQLRELSVDGPAGRDGHYYHVTHLRGGVFVQGEGQVVAGPWPSEPDHPREPGERDSSQLPSMATDGERFASLDELIAHLRTAG